MKAKTSMAFDGLAGKAGEVVASNNRGRLYLKRRSIPRNPRTEAQLAARTRLGDVSQAWGELTEAQRLAWNEAAKTTTGKSFFGQKAQLSGANLFARINANLNLIGKSTINTPPAEVEFPLLVIDKVTVAAGKVTIDLETSATTTGNTIIVRATPKMRAGRTSMPSGLRIVEQVTGTADMESIEISKASYEEKYGVTLVTGDKIQLDFYMINDTTGHASLRVGGVFVL